MRTSSKYRTVQRAASLLAIAVLSACGGRIADPGAPGGEPPEPTWAPSSVTVSQSPQTRIASSNAVAGGRDDLGTMHLLWEDGPVLRHGLIPLRQTTWTVAPVPTFSGASTVRRPVLGLVGGPVFIAAWLEQLGSTSRIVASRSLDRGATWDAPLSLFSTSTAISSPVLYAYRRVNGSGGAVIAWSDPATATPARLFSTVWRGNAWAASDFTSTTPISTNVTVGSARDVSLAGFGEDVVAAWADTRGITGGGTTIFISRSANGGLVWDQDGLIGVPLGTSGAGSEPGVAVGPEGDVVASWSNAGGIWVSRSIDKGNSFVLPKRLGAGFSSHPSIGDNGRIAIAWTAGAGLGTDESLHSVALSLSFDKLSSFIGPSAMPGSATTPSRTQARAFVLGANLDMIWTDVSGGTRTVMHRTAQLP